MLTESDKAYLRYVERDPWWMRAGTIMLPVFFVVLALLQLYGAAQLANGAELGLWDVIRGWHVIPEVRAYHPLEAAAIKSVERAFGLAILAIPFASASFGLMLGRARDKRIAAVLRKKGILERQDA